MSIVLGLFEGQMLLLATAILARHARADRTLGTLLIVLCGMLTPFAIGYVGFYDRWPWLSLAPFAVPLATGPLLYAHLNALVLDRPISRWHAALPIAQFAYQAAAFCLPLNLRGAFDREIQRPWLDPLLAALLLGSMVGYAIAGLRLVRRHRAWLRSRRADLAAADRVRGVLVAFAVVVALRTAYTIVDTLVVPLSYFDMFGFCVALAVIGNYLAIEGWRQSGARVQPIVEPAHRDWPDIARLGRAHRGVRGINGGAFFFVNLPGSGIEVDLPLIAHRPDRPQPDAGVTPDIVVPRRLADIVSARNRQTERATAAASARATGSLSAVLHPASAPRLSPRLAIHRDGVALSHRWSSYFVGFSAGCVGLNGKAENAKPLSFV